MPTPDETPSPPAGRPASSRRVLYGFNAALIALLTLAAVVLLDFVTNRYSRQWDCTIGSIQSLSPKSVRLIRDVDRKVDEHVAALRKETKPVGDKDTHYELVGFYPRGTTDPDGRDRFEQVNDLLNSYARAGKHITVGQREDIEARIKERYEGELDPYKTTVDDFDPLITLLEKFFKGEAAALGAYAQTAKLQADEMREAQAIQGALSTGLPEALSKTRQMVTKLTDSTVPEWSKAKDRVKTVTDGVLTQLKQFISADPEGFSKPLQDYFKTRASAFQKVIDDVQKYKDRVDSLAPLKMDDVIDSLGTDTVVILGPTSARVISDYDIYKPSRGQSDSPTAPKYSFEGEQAITSALLAMAEPNKPKVVFVTVTPSQLTTPGAPLSDIADRLRQANFDVLEWSPSPAMSPGGPPPSANPPASGKDVVWIVFPPDAPNPMMMMSQPPANTQPVIDAVTKHMADGGNVLFLAEASAGGPMGMMGGGDFPYAGLAKPFGINVQSKYTVVRNYPTRDNPMRPAPQIIINHFPNHPITAPLESLDTIFFAGRTQMGITGAPTVVDIDPAKPADVDATVIVGTEKTDAIWASSGGGEMKYDPAKDLASPIAMGVAAVRKDGRKVVVIGSKLFATNEPLEAQSLEMHDGVPVIVQNFPGNAELMVNTIYWLSNYENMIAVSPQATVALRISPMSFWESIVVRGGTFALPPIAALIVGIVVFLARRR